MTEPTSGELIPISAEVSLEDVAAIKVSEAEVGLIGETDILRSDVTKLNGEIDKLQEKLVPTMIKDTRKSYPELDKLEKALNGFFGSKSVKIDISFSGEKGKINVSVSGQTQVAWHGKESKGIQSDIEKGQKDVAKKQDQLVDARKKLCQLPALERSAKAAVARLRLSQSKAGQAILSTIGKVSIPGLPAPKK